MSNSPEASHPSGAQQGGTEWLKGLERVDRQVASAVKKVVQDLQDLASAAEEDAVAQLLAATARIDNEGTQSEILSALLEEGHRFASRTAFFLTRPGEVRGWAGRGFETSSIESFAAAIEAGSAWGVLTEKTGTVRLDGAGCAALIQDAADSAVEGVLIPFMLRGQLGGALYADRGVADKALGIASLQLLTHTAAQTIETAAVRGSSGSPTLRSSDEGTAAALWQPPESAASESVDEATEAGSAALAAGAAVAAAAAVSAVADSVTADIVTADSETSEESSEPEAAEPVVAEPAEEEMVVEEEPVVEEAVAEESATEEPVELEAADEEPAGADTADIDAVDEAVDFEMVSTTEPEEAAEPEALSDEELSAVNDIPAEIEPEPELEDTSSIWADDDDEDEGDLAEDPTYIGTAPDSGPIEEAAPPPEPVLPPNVGQETVRLDLAALQGQTPAGLSPTLAEAPPTEAPAVEETPAVDEDTAQLPQWDVEPAPEPSADFELEPDEPAADFELEPEAEPSEAITAAMETPDFSEDATLMTSRDSVLPDEEPTVVEETASELGTGYVPPAPAEIPTTEVTPPSTQVTPPAEAPAPASAGFASSPAPKPDATGSTQVVPPTDIQGPGSAFGGEVAANVPEGEEALHEEARRLARLLVSEIKLYNEEIIEEGRRSGNIYERLKDDIDRSRQMYEERIDPRLLEGDSDYFRQELVQRLAGGDEQLLGY